MSMPIYINDYHDYHLYIKREIDVNCPECQALYDQHDCKLSQDSGCRVCQHWNELQQEMEELRKDHVQADVDAELYQDALEVGGEQDPIYPEDVL